MATWTSPRMTTDNQYIEYWVKLIENSQSVLNNQTNVTIEVWIERTNEGYSTGGTGTTYLEIDGTVYTDGITLEERITSTPRKLMTRTQNITHTSDGTKTVAFRCRIDHSRFTSSYQSWNRALTKINRYSILTLSPTTQVGVDIEMDIFTNRADSSYTHTIRYSIGSASGTIATGVGASVSWVVPKSLANQFPNSTIGVMTIECLTYSGGTYLGTSSKNINVSIPNTTEFKPSISDLGITGVDLLSGNYIQNNSKVSVSPSFAGAYGSTVTNVAITMNGATYSAVPATSAVLKNSGTNTISVTVTDSRGRTQTATQNITVAPYVNPYITSATFVRTDASGNEQLDGEYVKVTAVGGVSQIIPNGLRSYLVEYKLTTDTEWDSVTIGDIDEETFSDEILVPDISSDFKYNFRVSVSDPYKTVTKAGLISTAVVLMDFLATGDGIAFGKVAETAGLADFGYAVKLKQDGYAIDGSGNRVNNPALDLANGDIAGVNGIWFMDISNSRGEGIYFPRQNPSSGMYPTTYDVLYANGGNLYFLQNFDPTVTSSLETSVTNRIYAGDSGWIQIPTAQMSNGFVEYTAGQRPQYRRVGKTVNLIGACSPPAGATINSATATTMFTLPAGFRPNVDMRVLCQGTGSAQWLLVIGANGNVTCARYSNGGSYVGSISGSEWLPFGTSFLTD